MLATVTNITAPVSRRLNHVPTSGSLICASRSTTTVRQPRPATHYATILECTGTVRKGTRDITMLRVCVPGGLRIHRGNGQDNRTDTTERSAPSDHCRPRVSAVTIALYVVRSDEKSEFRVRSAP